MASTFFLASAIGAVLGVIIAVFGVYTYFLYRMRGFAREIAHSLAADMRRTGAIHPAIVDNPCECDECKAPLPRPTASVKDPTADSRVVRSSVEPGSTSTSTRPSDPVTVHDLAEALEIISEQGALLARQHETIGFHQAYIDAIEKGVADDAVALPGSTLRVSILFHRHQHQLRARCGCSLCAALVKDYEAA